MGLRFGGTFKPIVGALKARIGTGGNTGLRTVGYAMGGYTPTLSSVAKITFATDTSYSLVGSLDQAKGLFASFGNTTHAYTAQGLIASAISTTSRIVS